MSRDHCLNTAPYDTEWCDFFDEQVPKKEVDHSVYSDIMLDRENEALHSLSYRIAWLLQNLLEVWRGYIFEVFEFPLVVQGEASEYIHQE